MDEKDAAGAIDFAQWVEATHVTMSALEFMRALEAERGVGANRAPGRRAMRDALAPHVLVAVKAGARRAQTAPFVAPERDSTMCYVLVPNLGGHPDPVRLGPFTLAEAESECGNWDPPCMVLRSGESQRDYRERVDIARAAYDRAQRAPRAKAFTYGPNARRVNPLVRAPYPPWAVFAALVDENPPGSRESESGYQLAGIRRAQRNERKRGRVPGVTGSPSGTGWGKISGKVLEARRVTALARLELRKIARRVKRHGGPFSKLSRKVHALYGVGMQGAK